MKAIDLIPLSELKVVYFDVDGVLSIPRYPLGKDNKIVSFTENARWDPFVTNNINAYADCHVPIDIKEWMAKLAMAGIPMCVLSASIENEIPSKMKFLEDNYPNYFAEIKLVPHAAMKKEYMIEQQKKFGYDPFEMALVEDNHYTLFEIAEAGFRGIHVSWFLDSINAKS